MQLLREVTRLLRCFSAATQSVPFNLHHMKCLISQMFCAYCNYCAFCTMQQTHFVPGYQNMLWIKNLWKFGGRRKICKLHRSRIVEPWQVWSQGFHSKAEALRTIVHSMCTTQDARASAFSAHNCVVSCSKLLRYGEPIAVQLQPGMQVLCSCRSEPSPINL